MGKTGNPRKRQTQRPGNTESRAVAHKRLDQLMDAAEHGNEYGIVAVDVIFEAGRIVAVKRRIDGSDKPTPASLPAT